MRAAARRLEVIMQRASRITRAHTIALPRPQVAVTTEWVVAGIAVALLLVGLLA